MTPILSIITIVMNDRSGLDRTLRSLALLGDARRRVQHVIVDGGSSDGTAELARSQDAVVVSERDEGIADAFNKGVNMSTGRWIHFLNAGDLAMPQFATVVDVLAAIDDEQTLVVAGVRWPGSEAPLGVDPAKNARLWLRMTVPHQGLFAPRSGFAKIGGFESRWQIAMDYDWIIRAKVSGFRLLTLSDLAVVEMDDGGVSQTRKMKGAMEQYKIQVRHRFSTPGLRELVLIYYVAKAAAEKFVTRPAKKI